MEVGIEKGQGRWQGTGLGSVDGEVLWLVIGLGRRCLRGRIAEVGGRRIRGIGRKVVLDSWGIMGVAVVKVSGTVMVDLVELRPVDAAAAEGGVDWFDGRVSAIDWTPITAGLDGLRQRDDRAAWAVAWRKARDGGI
jgi:hypothetical protein